MTTESVEEQQVVEGVAARIATDGAEGMPPEQAEVAPLTMADVQTLLSQQQRQFSRDISGLASKVDTGLNSIRRDTRTWAEQQIGDLRTQIGRQSYLEGLDEDQQRLVKPLLQEMDAMRQQRSQEEAPAVVEQSPQQNDVHLWDAICRVAAEHKVNPYDESLYGGMNRGLSVEENLWQFRSNISSRQPAATATTTPAAPQRPATATPPVEPGAANRSVGYRNAEDLRDAYMADRIPLSEYRIKMQALGETV